MGLKSFGWRHGSTRQPLRASFDIHGQLVADVLVTGPRRPAYEVRVIRGGRASFAVTRVVRCGKRDMTLVDHTNFRGVGYDIAQAALEFVKRGDAVAGAVASIAAHILTVPAGELRARSNYEHAVRQKAQAIKEQREQDRRTGFDSVEHGDYCDNVDDARALYLAGYTSCAEQASEDATETFDDVHYVLTDWEDTADSCEDALRRAFRLLAAGVLHVAYTSETTRASELDAIMKKVDALLCSYHDNAIAEVLEKV